MSRTLPGREQHVWSKRDSNLVEELSSVWLKYRVSGRFMERNRVGEASKSQIISLFLSYTLRCVLHTKIRGNAVWSHYGMKTKDLCRWRKTSSWKTVFTVQSSKVSQFPLSCQEFPLSCREDHQICSNMHFKSCYWFSPFIKANIGTYQ